LFGEEVCSYFAAAVGGCGCVAAVHTALYISPFNFLEN
jgi:hypothetical protein